VVLGAEESAHFVVARSSRGKPKASSAIVIHFDVLSIVVRSLIQTFASSDDFFQDRSRRIDRGAYRFIFIDDCLAQRTRHEFEP
jgi:hypothetical protein